MKPSNLIPNKLAGGLRECSSLSAMQYDDPTAKKREVYINTQEHDCSRGDVLCLIHRLTETPAVANITEYNEGTRIFRNVGTLIHTPKDSGICNHKRVNLKTYLFALVLIRSGQNSKQNAVKQQLCIRAAEIALVILLFR
jgi:hypothetical protein